MSFLGAAAVVGGSALAGIGGNAAGNVLGAWSTNSARESLNKNIISTNLKQQLKYERKSMQLDAAYQKWYQDMMYKLQANEYFDLAQRYGTNTASWAVEGLKKAGLNPVLAALDSNLSSSLGNAGPVSGGSRSSGAGVHGNAPSAGGSMAALRLGALQDVVNSGKQGSQIDAQTELLTSQKRKTDAETENIIKNEGLSGSFGAIANVLENTGLKTPLKKLARTGAEWLMRKLGEDDDGSTAHAEAIKARADKVYDSRTDSDFRGIIPDSDLDKINAHGLYLDSLRSPAERERERRLLNGRRYQSGYRR